MPAEPAAAALRKIGRPKSSTRVPKSVRLDLAHLRKITKLPRGITISNFLNEAAAEKIAATRRPKELTINLPKRPRKTVGVVLERSHLDWIAKHLPRAISISDFLNQALAEKLG